MAKNHELLWIAGLGAAGFAGYEFIYKPWVANQAALAAATAAGGTVSSYTTPPLTSGAYAVGAPYVTTPTSLVPQPITPSNLNPGANVGGAVGTCMTRKGWTQSQCQARLDALVAAFNANKATIAQLSPGGASLTAAQAQLAANQTALANANAQYNAALRANDPAGANIWKAAIDGHMADIQAITAAINSAPAKITAAQSAMAGNASDYLALTGLTLQ